MRRILAWGRIRTGLFGIGVGLGALIVAGCPDTENQTSTTPPGKTARFAYVANNVSDDVSAYAINPTTGALTAVGTPVAAGTNPFSVAVDPTGRFAYVANGSSNDLSVYTINQTTGALTAVGTSVATGTFPVSITLAPY